MSVRPTAAIEGGRITIDGSGFTVDSERLPEVRIGHERARVVFASPTGSTAYSLSVGGPIVPPWVPLMVVAPISSHTLGVRPVVVSDQEIIQAKLGPTQEPVNLVLDGQEGFDLDEGDEIDVLRASDVARIVVNHRRNFFKVLRQKMKWGG